MRRKHFRLKLERLRQQIAVEEGSVKELRTRRVRLRLALVSSETRLRALKAEKAHLASFKGKFVDSAVMHGKTHRHKTVELLWAIDNELDSKLDDIALGKQVIIEGMQKEEESIRRVEDLNEQIQQRLAADYEFERTIARHAGQTVSVERIRSAASTRAFNQWKAICNIRKRAKATLLRLVTSVFRGMLHRGFATWKRTTFKHRDAEARAIDLEDSDATVIGLGGRLLQKARHTRELAKADLTEMLGGLNQAQQSIDLAGRSRGQREIMFNVAIENGNKAAVAPAFMQLRKWHMQAKRIGNAGRPISPESALVEGNAVSSQTRAELANLRCTDRSLADETEMLITEGVAMADNPFGDHDRAEKVLRRAEFAVREQELAAPLARVYGALTRIYVHAERWDLAAVHADRWHKAATEGHATTEALTAMETWGTVLRKWGHHDAAICKLEGVLQDYELQGDDVPVLRVLDELAELYLVTGRADQHAQLRRRAEDLRQRDSARIADAIKTLQVMEGRLAGTLLREVASMNLEPVSPVVPALRVQKNILESTTRTLNRLVKAAEQFRSTRVGRKRLVERRLKQARLAGGTLLDVSQLDQAAAETERAAERLRNSQNPQQQRWRPGTASGSRPGTASGSRPGTASGSRPGTASGSRSGTASGSRSGTASGSRPGTAGRPATATSERGSRPPSASGMRGQAIDREQLISRLEKDLAQIELDVAESESTLRRLAVRIVNCEDDLREIEQHLKAERSELARKVYGTLPLRCVAFNDGNIVSNNVRGTGTGGVGKLATAKESVVMAFEMETGLCTNGFSGACRETAIGPPLGHTSRVVSIAFSGRIIVSGGTDSAVRVWDADQQPLGTAATAIAGAATAAGEMAGLDQDADTVVSRALRKAYGSTSGMPASALPSMPATHKHAPFRDALRAAGCMLLLEGHTGAVWSVAVNDRVVVSGGADQRVLVWRLRDGRLLRRLRGHEATVRTISLESHAFVSGSVEGELRLWDYDGSGRNPAERVTLRRRLVGHTASVTVTSMVGDEVVSGGSDGKVFVWNVDTGHPIREFQLHRGAVTAMQSDAVKIVTAGTDLSVKVTDVISGNIIQEFEAAHKAPIVALQFDAGHLVTASIDHTVKLWRWDDLRADAVRKEHILRAGEPIARVATTYGVTIQQIMKWNNVSRLTGFYQGQRVIVSEPPETSGIEPLGVVRGHDSAIGRGISGMRGVMTTRRKSTDKTLGDGVKRLLDRAMSSADSAAIATAPSLTT